MKSFNAIACAVMLSGAAILLATSGCKLFGSGGGGGGGGNVDAPKDMKAATVGWLNTIAEKFRALGYPFSGWSKLSVEKIPAEKKLGKYPVVNQNGSWIGGLYFPGGCKREGRIQMPAMADGEYNHELLGHECYHHGDWNTFCEGGHGNRMKDAGAPSWPFFSPARSMRERLFGGGVEIIEHTIGRPDEPDAIVFEIRDLSAPAEAREAAGQVVYDFNWLVRWGIDYPFEGEEVSP